MAYALLLFVPLSLALRYLVDAPAGWVFLSGAVAITGLADWLRRATEQLAERAGSTIGRAPQHQLRQHRRADPSPLRPFPGAWQGVPKIRALYEPTYFAGLRKAGMPEE